MKIYVASAFGQYREARAIMDALSNTGYTITCDWTRTDEFDEHGDPKSSELTNDQRRRYALADKQGVVDCDFLFLLDGALLRGAYMEFGAAAFNGKFCFVAEPIAPHIFYTLPNVQVFDTREEALVTLGVTNTMWRYPYQGT